MTAAYPSGIPVPGRRLTFIGLDSAEPELLLRWSRDGSLPNIARLLEESFAAMPATPPGMGNGAAWPAMFTGVNPGRNGRYYCDQFEPDTYEITSFRQDVDFAQPAVWQRLSEAGLRVAIIDVVRAPLTPSINGIQVADWMTHDRLHEPRSSPPELIAQICARYGDDPFAGNADSRVAMAKGTELARWRDRMIERIRTKTSMSRDLFEREPWDLFMTVYADPHDAGHLFWHLHDPEHPDYDHEWVARFGDPLKDVYVELDRAVGQWLRLAGDATDFMLFTAPGMGPNYTANGAMDEILARIERVFDTGRTGVGPAYRMQQIYRSLVPFALRRRVSMRKVLSRVTEAAQRSQKPRLGNRKFFAVPHNSNAGAVRFNLKGRESLGIVEPGQPFAELRIRLTEALEAIVNADSGKPLVKEVIATDGNYHGSRTYLLPDLFVIWNRDAPIRRLRSPAIGSLHVSPYTHRTGDHTSHAMMLVRTHDGGFEDVARHESRLEDVAPTIARMLGVELNDVDGSPLQRAPASRPGLPQQQDSTAYRADTHLPAGAANLSRMQ